MQTHHSPRVGQFVNTKADSFPGRHRPMAGAGDHASGQVLAAKFRAPSGAARNLAAVLRKVSTMKDRRCGRSVADPHATVKLRHSVSARTTRRNSALSGIRKKCRLDLGPKRKV